MITGAHAILYTTKPDEMRAFFRDVLRLNNIDAGGGWLIFALPPAELALHPADSGSAHHELSLMCDDLERTVSELRARGVAFSGDTGEQRWGRTIQMVLPDGSEMLLYEPRHVSPPQEHRG
jgi:catechol 2,3-dioxygenase-like lactoylglutathione lyase family enzyme